MIVNDNNLLVTPSSMLRPYRHSALKQQGFEGVQVVSDV